MSGFRRVSQYITVCLRREEFANYVLVSSVKRVGSSISSGDLPNDLETSQLLLSCLVTRFDLGVYEELRHPLLLLFSWVAYWYKVYVLSHSQWNTWFKIFVQVQMSKTGGAVLFLPTGANWSENSRNNTNQSRTCAHSYVVSYKNKPYINLFVL